MNGSGTSPPNIGNLTELKKVVVSWECCETAIQHCIDRWTKATAVTCRRLTTREMRFIKSRMTSLSQVKNDLITFENFKKFCQWFSPSLTTLIRVSSEWQCVTPLLFHGFVGRHDAEVMLKGKDQGTFLIRLSEVRVSMKGLDDGRDTLFLPTLPSHRSSPARCSVRCRRVSPGR